MSYIADTPEYLPEIILTGSEILTIVMSLLGILVSLKLACFFSDCSKPLAKRLKYEYVTDFLSFLVLFTMGTALFLNWDALVKIDVIIRPFVVFLNILAMWRLYNHYRGH